MPLDLRTLNAAVTNAEKLLNLLTSVQTFASMKKYTRPKLNTARAISELLDEQIHTLYDQAKENK